MTRHDFMLSKLNLVAYINSFFIARREILSRWDFGTFRQILQQHISKLLFQNWA
jgi:hypothetical protein